MDDLLTTQTTLDALAKETEELRMLDSMYGHHKESADKAHAIEHDLRLAHQMAARLAALEPVVEKAREWGHWNAEWESPENNEDPDYDFDACAKNLSRATDALAAALDALDGTGKEAD